MELPKTYYEILGISENATMEEIRRAYRLLIMKLHPDRAGKDFRMERFVQVQEAYKTLSNPVRRRHYDETLRHRRISHTRQETKRTQQETPKPRYQYERRDPGHAQKPPSDLSARVAEAAALFSQGKYERAESTARWILERDPRSAMSHAILGDIERFRGNLESALKHYAYAIQFAPRNITFQIRYEGLLRQVSTMENARQQTQSSRLVSPLFVVALVTFLANLYVGISREAPLLQAIPPIASWSLGLIIMMFLNGVSLGATLATSHVVDRWESIARASTGRWSQAATLGIVALVNFWFSAGLYLLLGFVQRSYTFSVSRLVSGVAILTLIYAFTAAFSPTLQPMQTLLWGGNVIYLGALCGWAVADAFR
ncbi:MAG TPA: J domain-containing protein [Fimbriimonadales bacterium]|nr:J domain-containing protein [Fimbriimonadales bacterium]